MLPAVNNRYTDNITEVKMEQIIFKVKDNEGKKSLE